MGAVQSRWITQAGASVIQRGVVHVKGRGGAFGSDQFAKHFGTPIREVDRTDATRGAILPEQGRRVDPPCDWRRNGLHGGTRLNTDPMIPISKAYARAIQVYPRTAVVDPACCTCLTPRRRMPDERSPGWPNSKYLRAVTPAEDGWHDTRWDAQLVREWRIDRSDGRDGPVQTLRPLA